MLDNQILFEPVFSKPVIHVLDYGDSPDELPHVLWQKSLKGESDVFISRAEIDLRKAMRELSFGTNSGVSSFEALAAASLPASTVALFWIIQALLQKKYPKPNLANPIYARNHDARLLFQQLAQLNLDPWYIYYVHQITPDRLPTGICFPEGHPVPGNFYRQHLLKTQQCYYHPTNTYFSYLFEERKKALLNLLEALGATKVVITPVTQEESPEATESCSEIFEFVSRSWTLKQTFNAQQHPWLSYEPLWESLIHERLQKRIPSISFRFDMDIAGLLKSQIKIIGQLMPELSSMVLPSNYEELLSVELLYAKRVEVEFGNSD